MPRKKRNNHNNGIIAAVLIVCTVVLRVLGKFDILTVPGGIARSLIYIALYIGWGISVYRRILYAPVRRYMLGVSFLAVFWFMLRTLKYHFVASPNVIRHLWYGYYVPILFIPLLFAAVSLYLGKSETFRLPIWAKLLLYLPTVLCVLLVLTNDLHQFVFSFPSGGICTGESGTYTYAVGYYFIIAWVVVCVLTAFAITLYKCRLAQRKKYLPVLVLSCSIVYAVIYASGAEWMQIIGGDIIAAQCLMFVGMLECCIQVGLIPTNTGYAALFEAGTFGAQITDNDYQIRYTSANSPEISKEIMQKAETAAVSLDKNTLLKSHPIDGGHVFWQEDITEITALLERLEENNETIAESNYLEQENYRVKLKIKTLREKNRLYDLLQDKTAEQVDLLERLFSQYNAESDYEKRRSLLAKIAVIGAYIKRCGNLIFIGEQSKTTDTAELSLCMEESFANLELMDIDCAMDIPGGSRILVEDAIRVYDFFEKVIETAIDDLQSVLMKARSADDSVIFRLEVESSCPLADFTESCENCLFEDGVWCFTLRIGKAGEQL